MAGNSVSVLFLTSELRSLGRKNYNSGQITREYADGQPMAGIASITRFTGHIEPNTALGRFIRNQLTGANAITTETIQQQLPREYRGRPIEPAYRREVLSIPFLIDDDVILKVITRRTAHLHNLLVRAVNYRARRNDCPPFLTGHNSPLKAAEYRFTLLDSLFSNGGTVPQPIHYDSMDSAAYVITNYRPTEKTFENVYNTDHAFIEALSTINILHQHNYVHADLYSHIFIDSAAKKPLITDPVGKAKEDALAIAKAYDIASLALKFTPALGSWSVAGEIVRRYPTNIIVFIPRLLEILLMADSTAKEWAAKSLVNSLNETLSGH